MGQYEFPNPEWADVSQEGGILKYAAELIHRMLHYGNKRWSISASFWQGFTHRQTLMIIRGDCLGFDRHPFMVSLSLFLLTSFVAAQILVITESFVAFF